MTADAPLITPLHPPHLTPRLAARLNLLQLDGEQDVDALIARRGGEIRAVDQLLANLDAHFAGRPLPSPVD